MKWLVVRPSALRRALLGALLLLISLAMRAQEEPVRFLLERITVEGPREAAGRIIRAETLLEPGGTYTEAELGQAVARVHRLPFVLDADFSLHKGSTRGAYELLIQVKEAHHFFFDHSIRGYHLAQPLDLDESISNDEQDLAASFPGIVGYRQFIGRSGMVFAALDSSEGIQVGFTRYDLFGRGIVASIGYSGILPDFCCADEVVPYALDPTFVSWSWGDTGRRLSVDVGIPLNRTDALRIGGSRRSGEGSSRSELFGRFRQGDFFVDAAADAEVTLDRAEIKWVRDTSNDPLLPTRGFTLSGGVEWTSFETEALLGFRRSNEFLPEPLPGQDSEEIAAVVSAARHWSITSRQTVSGMARLSAGEARLRHLPTAAGAVTEDANVFGGSLGVRHAVRLWQARGAQGFGDLFLESTAEYGIESTSPSLQPSRAPNPLERLEVSTGVVLRNAWGVLRILFSYLDVGEVWR